MKITTRRIVEKFPSLEEKVKAYESEKDEDLQSLRPVEDSGGRSFDLALLYKYLDND